MRRGRRRRRGGRRKRAGFAWGLLKGWTVTRSVRARREWQAATCGIRTVAEHADARNDGPRAAQRATHSPARGSQYGAWAGQSELQAQCTHLPVGRSQRGVLSRHIASLVHRTQSPLCASQTSSLPHDIAVHVQIARAGSHVGASDEHVPAAPHARAQRCVTGSQVFSFSQSEVALHSTHRCEDTSHRGRSPPQCASTRQGTHLLVEGSQWRDSIRQSPSRAQLGLRPVSNRTSELHPAGASTRSPTTREARTRPTHPSYGGRRPGRHDPEVNSAAGPLKIALSARPRRASAWGGRARRDPDRRRCASFRRQSRAQWRP